MRYRGWCLWLLVGAAATCIASCQSTTADFADPSGDGERWTLGELVYQVLRANLERADECSPEMVSALERNRDRFVETCDYTISNDIVNDLPELLGGTILPLVDSGDMPALTDAIALALALLIDDEFDPDRKALRGIVAVSKVRTVLSESQAIELVSRVLADPSIGDEVHALAGLSLEDDGADLAVRSALDLVRRFLAEPGEPSACAALQVPELTDRLLATDGFVADPSLGAPAWSARVDVHDNPTSTSRSSAYSTSAVSWTRCCRSSVSSPTTCARTRTPIPRPAARSGACCP